MNMMGMRASGSSACSVAGARALARRQGAAAAAPGKWQQQHPRLRVAGAPHLPCLVYKHVGEPGGQGGALPVPEKRRRAAGGGDDAAASQLGGRRDLKHAGRRVEHAVRQGVLLGLQGACKHPARGGAGGVVPGAQLKARQQA